MKIFAFHGIVQANDKNLTVNGGEVARGMETLWGSFLTTLCNIQNTTIRAENFSSCMLFSIYDDGHFKDLNSYKVRLDREVYHDGFLTGGYAKWGYPSEWSKNCSKHIKLSLGGGIIYTTFSQVPKNILMSLTVNWGEIVFHNTILGKYYSIRDAGTETITLILILTS